MSNAPVIESPYLTADEAAQYLRFPSTHWFRVSAKKYGIPAIRRGRRLFYTKQMLDEFMAVANDATKPTRPSRRVRGKSKAA